jgi:hypothetical protein
MVPGHWASSTCIKVERDLPHHIKHPYLHEFIKSSVLDRDNIVRGVNIDSIGKLWVVFVTILEGPRLEQR